MRRSEREKRQIQNLLNMQMSLDKNRFEHGRRSEAHTS